MRRDGVGRRGVLDRRRDRRVDAVRLRGAGQIILAASARFSRASGSPTCSTAWAAADADQERPRVREADVLRRVHDHAPRDESRVLARLEHASQPEEGGIGIGTRGCLLDERNRPRCSAHRPAGRTPRLCVGRPPPPRSRVTSASPATRAARTAASRPVSAIRASPPAILGQVVERLVGDLHVDTSEPTLGVVQGTPHQRLESRRGRAAPTAGAGSARGAECSARNRGSRWWRRSGLPCRPRRPEAGRPAAPSTIDGPHRRTGPFGTARLRPPPSPCARRPHRTRPPRDESCRRRPHRRADAPRWSSRCPPGPHRMIEGRLPPALTSW